MVWGDGKVIIERLCLSLPYVETFNSKVIKGFVPELRSRYVFFLFRDSYVLCIYVMNILCTFHIFVYGYVTLLRRETQTASSKIWTQVANSIYYDVNHYAQSNELIESIMLLGRDTALVFMWKLSIKKTAHGKRGF